MRLSQLLGLPAALVATVIAQVQDSTYNEHLHLQPLPGNALYAGFNFTSLSSARDYEAQHFRFFPRSLGQILQYSKTAELHLRFSWGRWDEESWGSRPRNGLHEGGTGVELWAWVDGSNEIEVMERWRDLVNGLSGLFCASLNFIDGTNTIQPLLSFDQEGKQTRGRNERLWLLHGTLPHEVVCTENLTPFLKLLPCKGKAGVSSLLDGHKLFDASWQSMAVDVRPVCEGAGDCNIEIKQTVDMVLDIARSMRPRHDPIPRPPPIEQVECDQSKPYNAPDTCYPLTKAEAPEWALSRIFGRPIKGSCHLGDALLTEGDLSISVPSLQQVTLHNGKVASQQEDGKAVTRQIILTEDQDFDLTVLSTSLADLQADTPHLSFSDPPLHASRQMTGQGQERGGMHATIRNKKPFSQRIVYLESLPWFLRPYMHTLRVSGGEVENLYYTPAIDRKRGTQLEILLEVPAESTVELTYDFEKAILRYTEYPPDANRGFDVAPAIIRVLPSESGGGEGDASSYYLRTTSLLLPLPTPDFSMPYNVIILTSTVIALGFGSIFNLLVRRFVLADEVPPAPIAEAVKKGVAFVKSKIVTAKPNNIVDNTSAGQPESSISAKMNGGANGLVKRNVARGSQAANGSIG